MEENKTKTIITKNQTAKIPTKNGGNYSYQYIDIAQIHDYLERNNMSYYQYIDRYDNDDYIMTVRIIDGEEKPALRGSRVVDATLFGSDNPAQKQGSALTYARRYSLLMAFGLATEDDDAQSLNKNYDKQMITSKQIELINKSISQEELPKILAKVNKEKIEDLTLIEASSLINNLILNKNKGE